jgi:hypothetical protein
VAAIDTFMAAEKRLSGVQLPQVWQMGSTENVRRLVIPIELGGEVSGASLDVLAYPNYSRKKFALNLHIPPPVWRLCFDEIEGHSNTRRTAEDNVPAQVKGPHYHPWEKNKRFLKGARKLLPLKNAMPLPAELQEFPDILNWFCGQTNILLPPDHMIQLPQRDSLI